MPKYKAINVNRLTSKEVTKILNEEFNKGMAFKDIIELGMDGSDSPVKEIIILHN